MGREVIRDAAHDDLDAIVAMGRRFLAETDYRDRISENPAQMRVIAERLIDVDEGALLVSDRDGALTGMIGLFVFRHPISDEVFATELFWWVEPEHRGQGIRLLRRAEAWAADKGAKALQMIAPTPQVARVYAALGYAHIEDSYQREL
jgi:GNAT superfamily N-acetyltransferase